MEESTYTDEIADLRAQLDASIANGNAVAKTASEALADSRNLRALLEDANGKLHTLQSMMSEAGFPMRVKLGEDLHGNEDFARVRPECQLGDVLGELREYRDAIDSILFLASSHPHLWNPKLQRAHFLLTRKR